MGCRLLQNPLTFSYKIAGGVLLVGFPSSASKISNLVIARAQKFSASGSNVRGAHTRSVPLTVQTDSICYGARTSERSPLLGGERPRVADLSAAGPNTVLYGFVRVWWGFRYLG